MSHTSISLFVAMSGVTLPAVAGQVLHVHHLQSCCRIPHCCHHQLIAEFAAHYGLVSRLSSQTGCVSTCLASGCCTRAILPSPLPPVAWLPACPSERLPRRMTVFSLCVLALTIRPLLHIHRAFVGRSFANSVDEAKYAFFSDDLPQQDAERYVCLWDSTRFRLCAYVWRMVEV